MFNYKACLGFLVEGKFKPGANATAFQSDSDEEAIKTMWDWAGTIPATFNATPVETTYVRLWRAPTPMEAIIVGTWPLVV